MRNKFLLLGGLFVAFFIFILIKIFIIDRKPQSGNLKVLSSPIASVFVDNKNVGKTPLDVTIAAGEHMVKLIPEATAGDTAQWSGKVMVNAGTRTFVDRELGNSDTTSSGIVFSIKKATGSAGDSGEIEINSEPTGAITYLDNDEKGISSMVMEKVSPGEHELSIYSPGFIRRSQKVNVEAKYRIVADFKLAIDPTYKPVDQPEATPSATTDNEATTGAKVTPKATPKTTPTPKPAEQSPLGGATPKPGAKVFVVVKDTPTGWLRVREEPSVAASESAKVNPGDKFELLEEKSGWQKIEYIAGKFGWVSGQYTEKRDQ